MTTKQFNWLRNNLPIEVSYFRVYDGKEPDKFHNLHPNKIGMVIEGEYFDFSGTYHTWNGTNFVQHYAKYKIHYKNIRKLVYRRKRQGNNLEKLS